MSELPVRTPLSQDAYDRYWTAFDHRFSPRLSRYATWHHRAEWVRDAVARTGVLRGQRSQFAAGEDAVNAEVLRTFVTVFEETSSLLALDWQHPGYGFRPHLQAVSDEQWRITPFPNGDYYAFVTEEMTAGTFGHPWEQSLCVFGDALVGALVPVLTAWLPVLRGRARPS